MRDSIIALWGFLNIHMSAYKYTSPPFYTFPIAEAYIYTDRKYSFQAYYASSPYVSWYTLSIGVSRRNITFWYIPVPPDEFSPTFELILIKPIK